MLNKIGVSTEECIHLLMIYYNCKDNTYFVNLQTLYSKKQFLIFILSYVHFTLPLQAERNEY